MHNRIKKVCEVGEKKSFSIDNAADVFTFQRGEEKIVAADESKQIYGRENPGNLIPSFFNHRTQLKRNEKKMI